MFMWSFGSLGEGRPNSRNGVADDFTAAGEEGPAVGRGSSARPAPHSGAQQGSRYRYLASTYSYVGALIYIDG